jgi:integrase/recombinase XerD
MTTAGSGIRVQKARKPGSGRPMWLVLGEDCLPIQPIDEFLTFHDVTGSSPNTIRSYAHHLKLYWEYLTEAELDWRAATLQDVIDFVAWLRWGSPPDSAPRAIGERRKPSTINAIVAAVTAFRVYHVRAGTMAGQIEYQLQMEPGRPYKPFLHHVTKGRSVLKRIVKFKSHAPLPRTLSDGDLNRVIAACHHLRDQFLVRQLADTGIRIGQALGLRHSDIKSSSRWRHHRRMKLNCAGYPGQGERSRRRSDFIWCCEPGIKLTWEFQRHH